MATTTNTGPNLTLVAYLGRQTVKFGALAIVILIVGRTFFTAFVAYWKATHPEPPPPPTMGFGLLPAIAFPSQLSTDKPASYTLETADGTTPNFGDRAKVFFMPKSSPSLLADQEARKRAADLGFVFEPEVLDGTTYRWSKAKPLESSLEMDIQTRHFSFTTDYLSRPELIRQAPVPDKVEAVAEVKSFLTRAQLLPADVATVSGEVSFLKVIGGELEPAVAFSDADFVRVQLKRNPIDGEWEMYTPAGQKSTIEAIVTGVFKNIDAVVDLQYQYQAVDYSQSETYPLRTTQSAWKLLQAGEAYVASKGESDQAIIRDVYLGYFDSFEEQEYLQPVYVFEGDDGFVAYVPALDPRVYAQTTEVVE